MSITKIILLLSALSIATYTIGATSECEINTIKQITNIECHSFGKSCDIVVNHNDASINAYTVNNNIIILSQGIINKMNSYELLAVVLHEIGHIKYSDYEMLQHAKKYAPNIIENKQLRHRIELRADDYATYYFNDKCMHNYLIDAFKKLGKADWDKFTTTHPSINTRVQNIQSKLNVTNCKYINK